MYVTIADAFNRSHNRYFYLMINLSHFLFPQFVKLNPILPNLPCKLKLLDIVVIDSISGDGCDVTSRGTHVSLMCITSEA